LDDLKQLIIGMMPEGDAQFPEDQLSTAPTRFLAAEIVREKVFEHLRQEVPYTTAVDIEAWEEDPERNLTVIHAVIFVARPSHKAMVIGRAGASIKEIGTEARRDIQNLIGGKVHLQLWVKVKDNWVEDTELLHDLGMEDD
jgi:GTP-binding protein Era